ncbi:hypothetical protein [Brevundimonas aurifodinae]|uniref:Uncharacterized protein n=3 Tax=Brevundimonas TaxID=41275 RepID=A0ABV1NKL9_9CAUL|nr:MAG: hypothetical protein B7Z42_08600 [Brevundimonas sp. 12-68-7]
MIQTFTRASDREALTALCGSPLLANGCVNLISLDAVRDRAGDLWPRKRELVWDFTDKRLRERLQAHDMVFRVDDTTYLIAVVADYAAAAQAVAMRTLEEILLHFIGRLDRAHIIIRRVDRIDGAELTTSPVDIERIPRLEDVPQQKAQISPTASAEREKNPLLFRSLSGRDLRVDFSPRPVTSLQHGVMTALHLPRQVVDLEGEAVLGPAALDALTDGDLIRIDEATLDYASLFTMGDQDAGYIALIIPVSYRTLLNRRGRAALIQQGGGQPALKTGALFEILDMDSGTPPSRIAEAVSLSRTMVRGVVARLPEGRGSLSPFTAVGLTGLTVPLARQQGAGAPTFKPPAQSLDRLRTAFRALIALDALKGDEAALKTMGYTHASLATDHAVSARTA